jgi:hypothetical protein
LWENQNTYWEKWKKKYWKNPLCFDKNKAQKKDVGCRKYYYFGKIFFLLLWTRTLHIGMLAFPSNVNAIMVTFGLLLSPWLITFPRHHAFCKKVQIIFSINILQHVDKNISNNNFFNKSKFPLNNHKNWNSKCDYLRTISHILMCIAHH